MVIENLCVGRQTYSFNYEIYLDGRLIQDDYYSGSHTRSYRYMRKELNDFYAVLLALQQL